MTSGPSSGGGLPLANRRRAAAVIIRDGRLLMVRERGRGPTGRHDGHEYWTLPGGGIEDGETAEQAVIREVSEEVGLSVLTTEFLYEVPYPSGLTSCFRVEVAPGEPTLGEEPDPACDCPRLIGLSWVPLSGPALSGTVSAGGPVLVPTLLIATPVA